MKVKQFQILRIIFGVYIFVDLSLILLDANQLLYPGSLVSNFNSFRDHLFKFTIFNSSNPNYLNEFLVILGMISSLGLATEIFRKTSAFYLWILYLSFFNFNPTMKMTPAPELIGITLFFLAFIPSVARKQNNENWILPRPYLTAFTLILGLTYLSSGLQKLSSVPWQEGSALEYIFQMPLGRDFVVTQYLLTFPTLLKYISWSTLVVEILCPLMLIFKITRPMGWISLTMLQIISLIILDIPMINIPMLIFHFFSFRPEFISFIPKTNEHPLSLEQNEQV